MGRKRYSSEEIITKIRKAEILISEGKTATLAARSIGVSYHTFSKWRKEYGGMDTNQLKQLKQLQKENSRLKKIVADLSLDNDMLKEVARGNF